MNEHDPQNVIRRLNRLDVERAEFDDIVLMLRHAITGVRVSVGLTPSTELYFRARICNSHKPTKVAELAAPPAEYVTGFQRCNPPGNSMFYSAAKRITALLECDVEVGDTVYLGQWNNREPAPLNRVLAMDDAPESATEFTANEHILHTYFDTIFTRPVHETFSNVYKLTAAATEVLTTGYNPNSEHDIRDDRAVGLIYPSVVDIAGSYNTVFHAEFANERIQLSHAMELKVKEREGKHIVVEVMDNAIEFIDGEIEWLGNPLAIPQLVADRNKLTFISNGRSWVITCGVIQWRLQQRSLSC